MHTKIIIYAILLNHKTSIQINTANVKQQSNRNPQNKPKYTNNTNQHQIIIQTLNTRNKNPTNKSKQPNPLP